MIQSFKIGVVYVLGDIQGVLWEFSDFSECENDERKYWDFCLSGSWNKDWIEEDGLVFFKSFEYEYWAKSTIKTATLYKCSHSIDLNDVELGEDEGVINIEGENGKEQVFIG